MDECGGILIYEKFRYLTIPNFIYFKTPLFAMVSTSQVIAFTPFEIPTESANSCTIRYMDLPGKLFLKKTTQSIKLYRIDSDFSIVLDK